MPVAELLWHLLGNWSGTEEQQASPFAPAARTRAMMTFKQDLAGTAVVQDYRQVRDDGPSSRPTASSWPIPRRPPGSCGGCSTPRPRCRRSPAARGTRAASRW